jgi:hypothetical protein
MYAAARLAVSLAVVSTLGGPDRATSRHQLSDQLVATFRTQTRVTGTPAPPIDQDVTTIARALNIAHLVASTRIHEPLNRIVSRKSCYRADGVMEARGVASAGVVSAGRNAMSASTAFWSPGRWRASAT